MPYKERLNPWVVVRLLPNLQRITIGQFRKTIPKESVITNHGGTEDAGQEGRENFMNHLDWL